VVSDDIGMHAVSTHVLTIDRGCQIVTGRHRPDDGLRYWTDTDRCRGFAQAMISAQRQGIISAEAAAQSRERVRLLLERAPQNVVSLI